MRGALCWLLAGCCVGDRGQGLAHSTTATSQQSMSALRLPQPIRHRVGNPRYANHVTVRRRSCPKYLVNSELLTPSFNAYCGFVSLSTDVKYVVTASVQRY